MLGPVNLDEEQSSMKFNYKKAFKYQSIASTKQSHNATRLHISRRSLTHNLEMADRMKHCVSCLIYFTSTLLACFDVLFKKRSGVYYQLSCINIFRFGLKNLKPLLAAESRSVQLLGEAGAL